MQVTEASFETTGLELSKKILYFSFSAVKLAQLYTSQDRNAATACKTLQSAGSDSVNDPESGRGL